MEEIWKSIPNYEGYFASSEGHIRNSKGKILKQYGKSGGYQRIGLAHWGVLWVHRLIALAFIPNPENKSDVNHINGIKDDNRVENLEWVSHKENVQHAYRTGLINLKKIGQASKDRIWIHNDNSSRMVKSDCLAYFLDNGYQLGRGNIHSCGTSGQIWVTDGKSSFLIKPEELDSYLNIGFYKGRIIKNEDKHKVSSTLTSPMEVS